MKYPNGKKANEKFTKKSDAPHHDTSRRGMTLESEINKSNEYYLAYKICNIHKKPTPITIVNVSYPSRNKAKITEAYFKIPSTTDYNGIYKGRYVDFEAKECKSRTAFPFSSIHAHQIKHLADVLEHGAIAFIIIRMTYYNIDYLIKAEDFLLYYNSTDRRSIPYDWIRDNGYVIANTYLIPVDFIKTIDDIYFKEDLDDQEDQ